MAKVVKDRMQPTAELLGERTRELWPRGSATPRAVAELAERGWEVEQRIEAKLKRDDLPE